MTTATAKSGKARPGRKGGGKKGKARAAGQAADAADAADAAARLMNPALLEVAEKFRTTLTGLEENQVRERYALGRDMNDVVKDKTGTYGTDAETLLLSYMGYKRDTARTIIRVADKFRPNEMNQLLALKNPGTGEGLTWSHFSPLSRLDAFGDAKAVAEDAVARGLSSKDLVKLVTARLGGKRSAGGRPNRVPQGLTGFLDDIRSKTALWTNAATKVWFHGNNLTGAYEAEAKKGLSAATVSRLEETLATLDELAAKARAAGVEVDKLLTKARRPRAAG